MDEEKENYVLPLPHPLLPGVQLAMWPRAIMLSADEYANLSSELMELAFLCPHQAPRILALAETLGLHELAQYVRWQQERDREASLRRGPETTVELVKRVERRRA